MGKMFYLFFVVLLFIGFAVFYSHKQIKAYGAVIILNGPSGSGKSSIQKEFQYLMMPKLWIKLGIDNLFDKPMPDITLENMNLWQSKNPLRWVETTKDKDGNTIITLFAGPEGEKVAYGMNSAIAEYAKNGCNIIVDYIAYKKEWLDDLQTKLKNINTYWIKVTIPLNILEERESARGTSPKGHARSHYDTVYWNINYDLEVNTDKESSKQIAERIRDYFKIL